MTADSSASIGNGDDHSGGTPRLNPSYEPYLVDGVPHVLVDVTARDGNGAGLLADLVGQHGLLHGGAYANVVSGLLPVRALAALETMPEIALARPSLASTNVGRVTSQDVEALRANLARLGFDVDGTGVTIGMLSDSLAVADPESELIRELLPSYTSFEEDLASGDLPPDLVILEDAPAELAGEVTDEGRAMAQLIHDIAPGADLIFATAYTGAANFARNIEALVEAGADIIVDDVQYFAEPMFQDGIIAQAAAAAVEQGVAYFASAGNSGVAGYEAPFRKSGSFFRGQALHDWDPGAGEDPLLDLTLQPGEEVLWVLQWDQPFLSGNAGGDTGPAGESPGTASDVNFYLLDKKKEVIAASDFYDIGLDPYEIIYFYNDSDAPIEARLGITINEGPPPRTIRMVDQFNVDYVTEFDVEHPEEFRAATTYGHSVAKGVMGVGAAPWFLAEGSPLVEGTVPEYFTSLGGSKILFDQDGNRLDTPEVRDAVDVTGSDGGNTTFFQSDYRADDDAFPNFFGTSAAAPNVAAVAALLLELNPDLTPGQIEMLLETSAGDIAPPFVKDFEEHPSVAETVAAIEGIGVGPGPDPRTGAGLVDANAALSALVANPETRPDRLDVAVYDALTDERVATIVDGGTIDPALLAGRRLTLVVLTPSSLGEESVVLNLNEGEATRTDSVEPYALFSSDDFDFRGGPASLLRPGENQIELEFYAGNDGRGALIETATLNFGVEDDSEGVRVALYDAEKGTLIAPLGGDTTLAASDLAGKKLTIKVDVREDSFLFGDVESVRYDLNDGARTRTESVEPYALFGDRNGRLKGEGLSKFDIGENVLELDFYSEDHAAGERVASRTIEFTIIDDFAFA